MNPVVTTMKELPVTERPYEKCAAGGPGILSDAELLAVILKSGCRGMTALELSQQLFFFEAGAGIRWQTLHEVR